MPKQRPKGKQADESITDSWAGPGRSGSVNVPKFDPQQRLHAARSFARWSLPASFGPLQAGKGVLLPALSPRNHHFTTTNEAPKSFSQGDPISVQLRWLRTAHTDAPVPLELVSELLEEDKLSSLELSAKELKPTNKHLAVAAAAGYPSYDNLAAHLRGNRLAAIPLPNGVMAVFSAMGQIGEVLALTLLRSLKAGVEPEPGTERAGASSGSSGRGGGGGGDGPTAHTRYTAAVPRGDVPREEGVAHPTAPDDAHRLQALPVAGLSLNKAIWEIVVKEHRISRTPLDMSQGPTDGSAAEGPRVFQPGLWRPYGCADVVGGGAGWGGGDGGREGDAPEECPAVWVAVRCNYCINVLLAYQVDSKDWRSWRLEWRASHATQRLIAALTWNPHLPELAFMLADGSVWIAATHAAAGGAAAALRRLVVQPVLRPMPPAVRYGRREVPLPPGEGAAAGQPLALLTRQGRLCVSYGAHPRTLLVARGRALLRVALHPGGKRHKCSLLHYLGKNEGNYWALDTGAALPRLQLSASPQQLLHLVVAVSERDVIFMDTRRTNSYVVLASPHGLTEEQLPLMLSLWAGPWRAAAVNPDSATTVGDVIGDGVTGVGDVTMRDDDDAGGSSGVRHDSLPQQPSQQAEMNLRGLYDGPALGSIPYSSQQGFTFQASQKGAYGSQMGPTVVKPLVERLGGLWGPNHNAMLRQELDELEDAIPDAATAPAAADNVASPSHGSLHLVVLLANERFGEVRCLDVVMEDAPIGMRVESPPQPSGSLSAEQLRHARLPYIALVRPLVQDFTVPGIVARSCTGNATPAVASCAMQFLQQKHDDDGAGATAVAGAAGPSVQRGGSPSPSTGTGGPATHGSVHQPSLGPQAAAERLPTLADAVWRPACLAHVNLLGMSYPPCISVRQELGPKLVSAMLGARCRCHSQTRNVPPGRLIEDFMQSGRHCPDLAGLAIHLATPSSSNAAAAERQQPLLLLRLSYDGDLLLQAMRRLPPGSVLATRSSADWGVSCGIAMPRPTGRKDGARSDTTGPTHVSAPAVGMEPPPGASQHFDAMARASQERDIAAAAVMPGLLEKGRATGDGLEVEVLEGLFPWAGGSSPRNRRRHLLLLEAYDSIREAHEAASIIKPSIKSPVSKKPHDRDKMHFKVHYNHLSTLLRWAMAPEPAGGAAMAAAAVVGATPADDTNKDVDATPEEIGKGIGVNANGRQPQSQPQPQRQHRKRRQSSNDLAEQVLEHHGEAGGSVAAVTATAALGAASGEANPSDHDAHADGGGSSWPPGNPNKGLTLLPEGFGTDEDGLAEAGGAGTCADGATTVATAAAADAAATAATTAAADDSQRLPDNLEWCEPLSQFGPSSLSHFPASQPSWPNDFTATQEGPLRGPPTQLAGAQEITDTMKRPSLKRYDTQGVAVVHPLQPTKMPDIVWSLLQASVIPHVVQSPFPATLVAEAIVQQEPEAGMTADAMVVEGSQEHAKAEEKLPQDTARTDSVEEAEGDFGAAAGWSRGQAAQPEPMDVHFGLGSAAEAKAVSNAAHMIRRTVGQRLRDATHPTLLSELSQVAVDAAQVHSQAPALLNSRLLFKRKFVNAKGNRTLHLALKPMRRRVLDRFMQVATLNRTNGAAEPTREQGSGGAGFTRTPRAGYSFLSGGSTLLWDSEHKELSLIALQVAKMASRPKSNSTGFSPGTTTAWAGGLDHGGGDGDGHSGPRAADAGGSGDGGNPPVATESEGGDGGAQEEPGSISLRSLGYTIPAVNVHSLNANTTVAVTVPPSTSLETVVPELGLRIENRPHERRDGGLATTTHITCKDNQAGNAFTVTRRRKSSTRADDLAYLHSLVTYQPAQLEVGVSLMVPEPCEEDLQMAAAAAAQPPPALAQWYPHMRSRIKRAEMTMANSRAFYDQLACRRFGHRLKPVTPALTKPGSVAPVLTPLASSMLGDLMAAWPEHDSRAEGGDVAAGAAQPRVLSAPDYMVQWAERLRPWPTVEAETDEQHPYADGEDFLRVQPKKRGFWHYGGVRGRDSRTVGPRRAGGDPPAPENAGVATVGHAGDGGSSDGATAAANPVSAAGSQPASGMLQAAVAAAAEAAESGPATSDTPANGGPGEAAALSTGYETLEDMELLAAMGSQPRGSPWGESDLAAAAEIEPAAEAGQMEESGSAPAAPGSLAFLLGLSMRSLLRTAPGGSQQPP